MAMAMLPVKVEQRATAEASPAFWMVVVAALHVFDEDCAVEMCQPCVFLLFLWDMLTCNTAEGSESWNDVLDSGHFDCEPIR